MLGLTIVPFLEGAKTQIPFVRTQHLTFGKDINAERKLSHIITWYSTEGDIRIRKEIYTLGSLSPPREIPFRGGTLRKTYNLFLSNATVCFPWPTRVSTQANFEIEWIESIIPRSFVVACGSPLIATIGSQIGRSIAVAASRGVCILDCSDRFQANHSVQRVSASSGDDRLFKLRPYVFPHRWCLFGNVTEEATFRVVAMSWWESSVLNSFGMDPIMSDDILIALIEVYGDCAGLYLACWSSRNLSLDGQLLSPSSIYSQESKQSQWGIVMPNGFQPSSLDILIQPNHDSIQGSVPMSARKASVLLTDCTYETKFMVYNIQTIKHVVNLKKSSKLRKYYDIIGWQAANGSIGSPADLFLVSASFICDSNEKVEERSVHENHPTSISTIGILRKYGGGLDAILVSNSSVTAFGSVLFSADTNPHNEQYSDISRIWLGDIVRREKLFTNESQLDCFVWILQLTNGKLFSWFVPFVSNNEDFHFLMRPSKIDDNYDYALGCYRVHTKGISLGLVCNAGTTSNWMQISSKGTRYDLLLGHVPKSFFGYAIGVSQSCKKLHRSLGEDFEKQIFRSDFLDHEVFCPGDFELYPPEFLPSLYSLFRGTAAATVKSNFNLPDFDDHLGQRLSNLPYQQTVSLMTVQLMILRCVEMIASLVNKNGNGVNLFSVEQCMLSLLVNTVRLHTTSLQFANLFLQLGRQLEPSCLQHLFPLPGSSTFRPEGYESTAWMLAKVLEEGSSRMATTALPLLGDRNTTKTTCAAIFRHCLLILDEGLDSRSSFDFNFPYEEKFAIGDVFRFALKISMPDMDFESDTEFDDETPQTTYSIFCRMPFFPRRSQNLKKKSAQISSLMLSNFPNSLLKGEDVFNMIPTIEEDNHCAALIFTRYILSVIVEDNGYKTKRCWNKIAAFAFLLVGDTTSGFRMCTKEDFGQLVRHFVNLELCNVLSSFLKVFILHCSNHLEPDIASRIFDLLLLLLGSASADLETEIPDLLLLAVVVGHTSERIIEILSDEPNESHLWTSYNSVRFELSV